jgi:putative beta barrel porin BBP7
MMQRIAVALGILLVLANSTFAQAPDEAPQGPPAPPTFDRIGMAPVLNSSDSTTGRSRSWWLSADYQITWMRGTNLPALATTSDAGTARIEAGVLGATGSSTLFGGFVNGNARSGFRVETGWWFNPEQTLGLEAGFMMTESKATLFFNNSTDGTILGRPFIDISNAAHASVLVAFPGSSNGSIDVRAGSGNFYEAHVFVTEKAYDIDWYRLYSLMGYRFYRYDESLRIQQIINTTDPKFVAGTQVVSNDTFSTHNEFHGLDLGFRSQFFWNNVTFDVLTKLAVGRVSRVVNVAGDQTTTVPGAAPVVQPGGVLALPSNIGTLTSADWKVMPEAGVTAAWQVRSNLSVRLGYSFILLNGINRAADQIDPVINPNFFPGHSQAGPQRPAIRNVRADSWIQTINLGMLWTY